MKDKIKESMHYVLILGIIVLGILAVRYDSDVTTHRNDLINSAEFIIKEEIYFLKHYNAGDINDLNVYNKKIIKERVEELERYVIRFEEYNRR